MNANNPKNKVYLGNIPFTSSNNDVRAFFAGFAVKSVHIVMDKEKNRSKGFAFVELSSPDEVRDAIVELDAQKLGGRTVVVNEAKERDQK
jgi:cold-inducible RNA-binding protein